MSTIVKVTVHTKTLARIAILHEIVGERRSRLSETENLRSEIVHKDAGSSVILSFNASSGKKSSLSLDFDQILGYTDAMFVESVNRTLNQIGVPQ